MSDYEYWIWYPRSLQYFVLWLSGKISLAPYSDLQLVNTSVHLSICNQLMLVQASMCVCVCSLLLLHSCLFNILTYCMSCGEEPDFAGMVLDFMITVMILNLVLILNKSSIQFILVNLSDRQLQIEKKKKKKTFCSLYTIIFLCNMLSLCWRALVCVANTTVLGCLCTWLGVWDRRL